MIRARYPHLGSRHYLLILLAAVLGMESFIACVIFASYPLSMDEYSYWLQSRFFASGEISHPLEGWQKNLLFVYLVKHNGFFFSKYPPAWAAVLSIGMFLGVPALVNPVLSTCTAWLLFLAVRMRFGTNIGLCCVLLLASNVYFLGYGASFFSQPLSLCLASATLVLMLRYEQTPNTKIRLMMGLLCGLTFFVRPLDAFCLLLAVGVATAQWHPRKDFRPMVTLVAPFAACVLALFTYHWILADCFCIATYRIWNSEFQVQYNSSDLITYISALVQSYGRDMRENMWPLFIDKLVPYAGIGFIALCFFGMYQTSGRAARFCIAYAVSMILLYNLHRTNMYGFPLYGARYWYPCMAAFVFFVAAALFRLQQFSTPRVRVGLFGFLIFIQLFQLAGDLEMYQRNFKTVFALRDDIHEKCASPSIIYVGRPIIVESTWQDMVITRDLVRNEMMEGPDYWVTTKRSQLAVSKMKPEAALCNYRYTRGTIASAAQVIPRLNWDTGYIFRH